ncbi:MAG: AAA family ATPase [bacterium]|nr:AAA family ATPase [bacterium]
MPPKDEIFDEVKGLEDKVQTVKLPQDLKEKLLEDLSRLRRIVRSGSYTNEYEQAARYVNWIVSLPWDVRSEDNLDLEFAKKILDKNHYGLTFVKERILEYLAVLSLNRADIQERKIARAPILCFSGLVGTGKTTIAYSIAEAMGRKFERIAFGGVGDPLYLRGQSRAYPEAEPGQIIKAIKRAGTKNPVILLDEIDRVVEQSRATIMGVLVELLDPEQNMAFSDHYLDCPFDLSEVLFIATCNNTTNISIAVLDRVEPIQMPSYTDEEKIVIGKNYVLPKTLVASGLTKETLSVAEAVWPKIVRPLGYDAGIRTLERTINGICRKVAKMIVEKKGTRFNLTEENIKEFLPTW